MHGIKRAHLSKDGRLSKIEKDAAKIIKYRRLNDTVFENKQRELYNDKAFNETTALLNLNPELYSIWNYRRDILVKNKFNGLNEQELHELFQSELRFVQEQLYKYPKCYWIWNHRIWCLNNDRLSDWLFELKLIAKFFQADSRNYHVWQYRRFIVECLKKTKENEKDKAEVDYDEFKFTSNMINKDISNYSAWHNRSKLIGKLFLQSPEIGVDDNDEYLRIFNNKSKLQFLKKELILVKTAFYTDPDDSSVWIYMKWLFGDYFLSEIESSDATSLINETISDIQELNELELSDEGRDNQCGS
ncbi:hypothetical protein CANARDRAFT_22023 [[Candida] arabinofermentans NRRL YB-2248]|uniref:Geranylgeranyl transferase type-2 subunit alpha n=1 Tax=[Candida] arabinofermentans NRRL YB-2248 TaxID=983967 RepID=A0A1E4T2Y3_9ASCO|nr:hypothetical protein CANARDRAFT_22023 [[Candida] arabinofermentans NRRL YB-2248]